VCAGVSAIWTTALMGMEGIALEHPHQVRFERIERAKPNRKPIPVASARKKKTRR
jgi:uncharacterized protein YsxB (DUF464 family)